MIKCAVTNLNYAKNMGSSQLLFFLNIESTNGPFSSPNSSCYISANLYVTCIKLLDRQ